MYDDSVTELRARPPADGGQRTPATRRSGLEVRGGLAACLIGLWLAAPLSAQLPEPQVGTQVPRDVREMYDRGAQYLAASQATDGSWPNNYDGGPGATGLAVLALLASGEDPNFGQYSLQVQRGLRAIIRGQNRSTGYFGTSMYHHGFAMLALAEAYGAVDDRQLWSGQEPSGGDPLSIGQALELSVRSAITSQQKNPYSAWRYSPDARDADTSVAGAVLMGLLAARNAGIEVPDESIDQAIEYFCSMTAENGVVAYAGGMGGFGESLARSSIACLVLAIAKRKETPQYRSVKSYLTENLEQQTSNWKEYARYYQAQALFQADLDAWEKWNRLLIRELKSSQHGDGHFDGQFGPTLSTSMNLLALALNYRFLPIYER
jgi:hypothetical protein